MTDPFEFAIRPWQYQKPDEIVPWNAADHEHNYRELEDYLRNLVTDLQSLIFATQWVLYKDDSGALTINGDEQAVCLLDQWQHSTDYGDHVGWWNVRATATGSGTVTFKLVNLNGSVVEETWVEDFNAATFDNVVFNGTWARKDLTDYVRMILTAEVTSGSGTLAVASGDANLHALVLSLIGGPATLPAADSQVFSYTGAVQSFEVPPLVTSITVKAYGGSGTTGGGNTPGRGDYVVATVPVTPGETLDIYVGGQSGTSSGGFNGGGAGDSTSGSGGGGGASDVRRFPYGLTSRLVVAGGGGGAGSGFTSNVGGHGGYPSGDAGTGGNPGAGGTASAGGTGGGSTTPPATPDGSFGQGGDGGNGSGTRGGGGGGGGWYGGGGGGATFGVTNAGGGGGSSYVDTASGVVLVSSSTGGGPATNTATITIEWGA